MTGDLLSSHDVLLADLDGTLYRGPDVVPGAVEAVRGAERRGVPTVYVTNNASRSPAAVAEHLAELGFPARVEDVRASSQAGAAMLAELVPPGATVLVVGAPALADEVRARGLVPTDTADGAVAVVQGHSPDTGWRLLAEAAVAIHAGVPWVATNVDLTLPTERGMLPGNGSMVQVVRNATGADPAVAGKPAARLLREAQGGFVRPLVVGDRLDTDIEGANALGAPSLMVLTGVSGAADLLAAPPALRPTYLGADLASLTRRPDELTPGARDGWTVAPGTDGTDGADGLVLSGDGEGTEPVVDALRALCAAAWAHGTDRVVADGEPATRALRELGLPG